MRALIDSLLANQQQQLCPSWLSIRHQYLVVVVVVMTSPSGNYLLYGGQRCSEEMRNYTRLWIRRDPSLPRGSWQPFYWLGHHSRAAVIAHSWRIVKNVKHCQTIDVDGCRQTVKLQSVLRLCSGFYRSKEDPTNSIIVLKEVHTISQWMSSAKTRHWQSARCYASYCCGVISLLTLLSLQLQLCYHPQLIETADLWQQEIASRC